MQSWAMEEHIAAFLLKTKQKMLFFYRAPVY
jgi:hypothetical protein